MAGTSLFALLDDVISVCDDVAILTKKAIAKTSGVIGDDLALNAQQLNGISPEKELPIIWAVAKGAFKNKLILVPLAIAISALMPWLISPLLMLGGAYFCFEGVEKIYHKFHPHAEETSEVIATEEEKIKGAIRTDFVLSAEIIVIAMGAVSDGPLLNRVLSLSTISVLMTVGVYGVVALIIKLDDIGFYFAKSTYKVVQKMGLMMVSFIPYLMRTLSFVGTAAMFLVGGGIIVHGIPGMGHGVEALADAWAIPVVSTIFPMATHVVTGLVVGAIVLVVVNYGKKF